MLSRVLFFIPYWKYKKKTAESAVINPHPNRFFFSF